MRLNPSTACRLRAPLWQYTKSGVSFPLAAALTRLISWSGIFWLPGIWPARYSWGVRTSSSTAPSVLPYSFKPSLMSQPRRKSKNPTMYLPFLLFHGRSIPESRRPFRDKITLAPAGRDGAAARPNFGGGARGDETGRRYGQPRRPAVPALPPCRGVSPVPVQTTRLNSFYASPSVFPVTIGRPFLTNSPRERTLCSPAPRGHGFHPHRHQRHACPRGI